MLVFSSLGGLVLIIRYETISIQGIGKCKYRTHINRLYNNNVDDLIDGGNYILFTKLHDFSSRSLNGMACMDMYKLIICFNRNHIKVD